MLTLLEAEYRTYWCTVQYSVLLGTVRSHVQARPAARQSFSYIWGAAGWGECICLLL
jgi:hypothetical protein